jgi:hypothetical protein
VTNFSKGSKSLQKIFEEHASGNTILTRVIRVVGFLLMWLGLKLIWGPLEAIVDVVPLLGPLVGFATSVGTFIGALVLSLMTVMTAWLWYRPVIAVSVIAVCVAAIYHK